MDSAPSVVSNLLQNPLNFRGICFKHDLTSQALAPVAGRACNWAFEDVDVWLQGTP